MAEHADLMPGTLDLMILSVVADGEDHGYGIVRSIQARSGSAFLIEEGTLYPALRRLEKKGQIEGCWRASKSNRRARYYTLTESGRGVLRAQAERWRLSVASVNRVLEAGGA